MRWVPLVCALALGCSRPAEFAPVASSAGASVSGDSVIVMPSVEVLPEGGSGVSEDGESVVGESAESAEPSAASSDGSSSGETEPARQQRADVEAKPFVPPKTWEFDKMKGEVGRCCQKFARDTSLTKHVVHEMVITLCRHMRSIPPQQLVKMSAAACLPQAKC